MLHSSIEKEVDDVLAQHARRRDGWGNRLVVRTGYLPARETLTGAERLASEHAGQVFEICPIGKDGQGTTAARIGFCVPAVDETFVESLRTHRARNAMQRNPKTAETGMRRPGVIRKRSLPLIVAVDGDSVQSAAEVTDSGGDMTGHV